MRRETLIGIAAFASIVLLVLVSFGIFTVVQSCGQAIETRTVARETPIPCEPPDSIRCRELNPSNEVACEPEDSLYCRELKKGKEEVVLKPIEINPGAIFSKPTSVPSPLEENWTDFKKVPVVGTIGQVLEFIPLGIWWVVGLAVGLMVILLIAAAVWAVVSKVVNLGGSVTFMAVAVWEIIQTLIFRDRSLPEAWNHIRDRLHQTTHPVQP